MLGSLAIIIIFGSIFYVLFEKIKLPGLLGMLLIGVVIGPYGLGIIHSSLLAISADLRLMALIIILLRAGLGVKKETLKKVGRPAILLGFLPALFEGFTILIVSSFLLGIDKVEAGMLGFILAAVSPAVVVPSMLKIMSEGKGEKKGIPTLILAGASIDDVMAITIFSSFVGLYTGQKFSVLQQLSNILIAILSGVFIGIIAAYVLIWSFKKFRIRDTKKILFILALSFLILTLEHAVAHRFEIAGLLGVMAIGFVILEKIPIVGQRLTLKLSKIWVLAELLLFVLVGAEVNIFLAREAGLLGITIIIIGLLSRGIGVLLSLYKSNLNLKEKIFCIIAYSPKATVQAAIGGVPLALGVPSGDLILSLAVLAIIVTAPLGAVGIKYFGERLLE